MRQFAVHRLRSRSDQLVVILQHDGAGDLATRIVAPLSASFAGRALERARIVVDLDGDEYVVQLDRMAAVETREIGRACGSLDKFEQSVKNGIDLLLFGV